jgi:hypothetical protein
LRHVSALAGVALLAAMAPLAAQDAPAPVTLIYSNEEQVYFAKELKHNAPALVYLKVEKFPGRKDEVAVTAIDAFGAASQADSAMIEEATRSLYFDKERGVAVLTAQGASGLKYELRRARPATCWVAVKKDQPKADGSPDWYFQQGVKLHDQGGRALVGGGETGAPPLVIRMRNVIWPPKADGTPNTNKPSIVLYVHKPDKPDSAESYVWADPGAARIGINLRWMQASCGIDGMEPSAATAANNVRE